MNQIQRRIVVVVLLGSVLFLTGCPGTPPPPPPPSPTPTPASPAVKPCNGDPNVRPCFLSRKGIGTHQESIDYYNTVDPTGAKTTFAQWLALNGFGPDGRGDVRAVYYNDHDLNLGRDMNCRMTSSVKIACYVTNYGPNPPDEAHAISWFLQPDANKALADVTAAFNKASGDPPFATVAMEWYPFSVEPSPFNNVSFYVFDGNGNRQTEAVLDSEGKKQVPQICLPCHGGAYDSGIHSVTGASFLPFDVFHFAYSADPKLSLAAQQENFRILNAIVRDTNPNPTNAHNPVVQLIDTWYPNGVNAQGSAPIDKEPPGWSSNSRAYLNFVAPYCRSCHIAQKDTLDFTTLQQFRNMAFSIREDVCRAHRMPHAEVPFNRIWGPSNPIPGLAGLVLDDPNVLPTPIPNGVDKRCQDQ